MSRSEPESARNLVSSPAKTANILLLMSASIACAKASALISLWHQRGHQVRVVCSRSVAEFVGPATLQGLGAEGVLSDVFAPDQALEHIALGRWADLVIVAPATSNLINKLAHGIADDAPSTVWQAAYGQGKPMLIVPAMNTRMWRYPATRESVRRLQQWGIHVLPVGAGELACGERGEGRLLEPAEILKMVDRLLQFDQRPNGKRILITAGGTRERIDSVRYIGNLSSGRTAAGLADELTAAGHHLTWLGAEDALPPTRVSELHHFYSFADLQRQLRELLGSNHFDVVIHVAAVSDFRVARITTMAGEVLVGEVGKLESEAGLQLQLERNPKLLGRLKRWSQNPNLQVIGFKLTDTRDHEQQLAAIKKQFETAQVDAVVHNDLAEITASSHPFHLHAMAGSMVRCSDTEALARSIDELVGAA